MELDAVVVGSGPNGLAAAITLAAHGLRVRVLEAADRPGGGLATDELTRPGFRHDVCSAIHPMGVGSPLFRALPLEAHGLTWIHPEAPLAHPLDDQPPAVLERSIDRTAAGLAPDVDAYRAFFEALVEDWDEAIPELLGPIGPRLALLRAARYGWRSLGAADSVGTAAFQGTRARALFAGIAAHSIIPLDRAPSAAIALVLGAAGHAVGWPLPRGGSGALAAALVSILEALGGEVVCGRRVRSVFDLPPARATLLDLGPAGALEVLGAALPRRSRRALSRYPYGPGAFKLDWVLTEPIPWRDPACGRAGTVHLGGIAEEVAEAEAAVWRGVNHERPFVLLAQPTRFDETRAPVGGHVAWAYCHVVPGSEDDMTSAIEEQVERFAPGFRDCIEARSVLSPGDLEARNANLVGGDVGGGALTLRRALGRAVSFSRPYALPAPGLFLCSAATPPGAGVHGMCGYHAARAALRRVFGIEVPRDPMRVFSSSGSVASTVART